jgi:hypothetical protein
LNNFLGELEVTIGDQTFTLRPCFDGLMEMEARSGLTISQLVNKFLGGRIGITDLVAVIYGGVIGAPEKNKDAPTFAQLGEIIMAGGMTALIDPALKILLAGYSGRAIADIDKESKKKRAKRGGQA